MHVQCEHITVKKTARYYITGAAFDKTERIWIVLHGFGQTGKEFIENFDLLLDGKTLVAAPEALNKYYLKGFSGQVGATWMTREDREAEIHDYTGYLNDLIYNLMEQAGRPGIELNILGFSQGTATAGRWVVNTKHRVNRLVLWGGGIPPDIDLKKLNSLFENGGLDIVIGSRDQFITEKILTSEIKRLDENNLNYELHRFEGGHEINQEALKKFI